MALQVTDINYRGNGFTATFNDGSVGEAQFKIINGSLEILGLTDIQKNAVKNFNFKVSGQVRDIDARMGGGGFGLNEWGYAVDDLRVPLTTTTSFGSNPMNFGLFRSQAGSKIGQALSFDGVSQFGYIKDDGALFDFSQSWSTSFWAVIDPVQPGLQKGLLNKTGAFYISPNSSSNTLQVRIFGSGAGLPGSFNSSIQYLPGQKNHIVLTAEISGSGPYTAIYVLYINGVEAGEMSVAPSSISDNSNDILYCSRDSAGRFMNGVIDDIRWYNTVLPEEDILNLYADGQGTQNVVESLPTQAALLLHHKLDDFDDSGDPVTSDATPAVSGYEFNYDTGKASIVDGLISQNSSRGVFIHYAPSNVESEVFFSMQMSHAYIPGTPLEPHVHFIVEDTPLTGTVQFELEYTIANSFGGTFGDTKSLIVNHNVVDGKSHVQTFGYINGAGLKVSHMLIGRLSRKGQNDTYSSKVGVLELDIHYAKNRIGDDFDSVDPWKGPIF